MNFVDIIIVLILGAALWWAFSKIRARKKNGGCSCCSGCSGSCGCGSISCKSCKGEHAEKSA